jgi:hypothetical protein
VCIYFAQAIYDLISMAATRVFWESGLVGDLCGIA